MADRYDPKLSVRPLSDRKPAAPADDSDPLVELARIVSGRTTFDPAPAPKAKTVPVNPAANGALSAEPILANDLESELMNDLQASFAAVAPAAPKPAAPAQKPAQPLGQAPAARPAQPPAAKAAPAPQPRPAPAPPAGGAPFIPPKVATPSPRPAAPPPARPAAAPVARPATPPPAKAPAAAERPARPAVPPPRAERAVTPSAPAQPAVRPAERGDFANVPLRPTAQAHAEPPPAAVSARWEKAPEVDAAGEPSRFAPPRARNWFRTNRAAAGDDQPARPAGRVAQPLPPPELTEADHEIFEDVAPSLAEAEEFYQDDLVLDEIAHYGDDDAELPPLVDELPDMGHRRTSRGLVAVGALLAVALAGGAAYALLGGVPGTTAGTPPVIAADPSPTKIAPPDDGGQQVADAQNKLIYDRVDPGAQPAEDATNLVTPGSEKIADVSRAADADDGNPVSRVIMQGGPGYDGTPAEDDGGVSAPAKVSEAGGAEPAGAAAPSGDTDTGLGPRKVRTVVVRPDGTIVSSEAAPADGSAAPAPAAGADKPPSEVAGALDMSNGGTTMDTVLGKGGSIPVNSDPLAASGAPTPPPAGTVPAGDGDTAAPPAAEPAAPAASDDDAAAAADQADDAAAAAPEPPAKPAAKPKTVVAKGEPIDLTPAKKAAPAATPADGAAVTGGLSVQVTSQKSEAAALSAYRSMQSRYAQVLARYQPNVQRADLGDRGTYYRVRVGPFAGDGAQRVCNALKAAGGDCIIVK